MSDPKKIKSALISVFHKDGLAPIVKQLNALNITIYSTGGTQKFIENLGIDVIPVEEITSYPSILGGRVKTLHPKIFGGILNRRENENDQKEISEYEIPEIDLVIVDLYPFEKTVSSGATHSDIIEKIDIGGISLIRGAAKNYNDVVIIPSMEDYSMLEEILAKGNSTTLKERKYFAARSFAISSHYDSAIFNYFNADLNLNELRISENSGIELRYGENPHQKGVFYGKLNELFEQEHGKAISYNNLLDIDAAINLISEFNDLPTVAILKHNNACGLASRNNLLDAWKDALAGDPVSAFGGIIICNREINQSTAEEINKIFCEVVIAPSYTSEALETLKSKKNRIILIQKECEIPPIQFRSLLNGVITQDKDYKSESPDDLESVTTSIPTVEQISDLVFANKLVKHTKSNTIVLAKNGQLIASGTGQTSRVDALNQAIEKAKKFNFDLQGAVLASDAFFPFPDCVEIADNAGIKAVIQPGGSIKDQLSIDYCNKHNLSMVFTGTRHFKH